MLEDESRNALPNDFLFAKAKLEERSPGSQDSKETIASEKVTITWQVFVFRFRCRANKATNLKVKLFCESHHEQESANGVGFNISEQSNTSNTQNTSICVKLFRVFEKTIEVPKFAMFTFAKITIDSLKEGESKEQHDEPAKALIGITIPLGDRIKSTQVRARLPSYQQLITSFFNIISTHTPILVSLHVEGRVG